MLLSVKYVLLLLNLSFSSSGDFILFMGTPIPIDFKIRLTYNIYIRSYLKPIGMGSIK